VKKKIAGLDKRIHFAVVAILVLIVGYLGHMLVVSPQAVAAAKLQKQADAVQLQIYQRKAQLKAGLHPPTIETADLFRLARAMPDQEDMPGIILTLSDVAHGAGIKFDLIEPVVGGLTTTGSYQTDRIHLLFNGDFYGLSDFLYRLRSLVAVRNGDLEASGRLFNVDTVTFNVIPNAFPRITAELFVNAYVYGSGAPAAAAGAPSGSSASSTTTDPTAASSDATAAGVTP
jgi:Tfp pilus assembly protein PilO